MCGTCLERVLNILYCSLIIAFQHYYLNAASFMGSEKMPFTGSQEQSGNLECDMSHHLCAQSASPLLFGSFISPDSLASCSRMILIDLCTARTAFSCVMQFMFVTICSRTMIFKKVFPRLSLQHYMRNNYGTAQNSSLFVTIVPLLCVFFLLNV